MKTSGTPIVLGLLCALSASCATTHELEVAGRAVEITVDPDPRVRAAADVTNEQLAEIRAFAEGHRGQRQVLLEVRVDTGHQVHLPRLVVFEDQVASAFFGDVTADGRENGISVDVIVTGNAASVTAVERKNGMVLASKQVTIPVEAPSAAGPP